MAGHADTLLFQEPELRALLAREEGQFLELESLWDRSTSPPRPVPRRQARDTIAETVAAFANAAGTPLGRAYGIRPSRSGLACS